MLTQPYGLSSFVCLSPQKPVPVLPAGQDVAVVPWSLLLSLLILLC